MYCRTTCLLASKLSGTFASCQARSGPKKPFGLCTFLNHPVSNRETLVTQRFRYNHRMWEREPVYHPGWNTKMDCRYRIFSTVPKGVLIAHNTAMSKGYKFLSIDPDIQKHYRSRELRQYYRDSCQFCQYSPHNPDYDEVLDSAKETRNWRMDSALKEKHNVDTYIDPNLYTKGIVKMLMPLDKYTYM